MTLSLQTMIIVNPFSSFFYIIKEKVKQIKKSPIWCVMLIFE
jgi:hypothetical protein